MIGTSQRTQQGSLTLVKNKRSSDTWFLRYYEVVDGRRVYRRVRIGDVKQYPRRRDAERAVLGLRIKINSEVRSPETVSALIAHYLKHELTTQFKAFSTVETNSSFLKLYVEPTWGATKLSSVRTVAVEQWIGALPIAPATQTKVKAVFSALFAHAVRHEWIDRNPLLGVRTSSKPLREKDVLTPTEFELLLAQLDTCHRSMVLLVGSTGLRRSEFIGLRWKDVDFFKLEVSITRSCVKNRFGNTKTLASRKPVPLHPVAAAALSAWRTQSTFGDDEDFIYSSARMKGVQPLTPDTILKKVIRPALVRAGVTGKVVGWHTFRHSLATNLRSLGVDVKVAQELLRHANSRTTMDIYTKAVPEQKREATNKVVELLLSRGNTLLQAQHPSEPVELQEVVA